MRITVVNFTVFISVSCVMSYSEESSEEKHHSYADQSFRQLQSGENSDELVNQCCVRIPKLAAIGHGVDGSEIRVDVGECRQVCESRATEPLRREKFDEYLRKYPHLDPIKIFMALQSRLAPLGTSDTKNDTSYSLEIDNGSGSLDDEHRLAFGLSSASCIAGDCIPVSTRKEMHFGLGGEQKSVEVIQSCDCFKRARKCEKTSKIVHLHPGTPFEKMIDVGECRGPCGGDGTLCRPIRNKTVNVEGPNGAECYETIEECQCTGSCYRSRKFFKVFDYSRVFTTIQNDSRRNETSEQDSVLVNSSEEEKTLNLLDDQFDKQVDAGPVTKVIDIGRCEGRCNSGLTSKCLSWSEGGRCLTSLYGGRNTCTPSKFFRHAYVDSHGHRHSLLAIISCACH